MTRGGRNQPQLRWQPPKKTDEYAPTRRPLPSIFRLPCARKKLPIGYYSSPPSFPPGADAAAALPCELDLWLSASFSMPLQSWTPLTFESKSASTAALARVCTLTGLSMNGSPSRLAKRCSRGGGGLWIDKAETENGHTLVYVNQHAPLYNRINGAGTKHFQMLHRVNPISLNQFSR